MKTKYKVRYSPAAVDDLKEIYSYIANELKVQETAQQQTERIRKVIPEILRYCLLFGMINRTMRSFYNWRCSLSHEWLLLKTGLLP